MFEIPVFYTEKMVVDSQSFSPSAAKPKPVVESWLNLGIPLSVRSFLPTFKHELCYAHDVFYVSDVLDGKRDNGFGNRSSEIAATFHYTVGSMMAAAREALLNQRVAVAPCSGFHHAGYYDGQGFCTFNGLIISAIDLLNHDMVERVGILDFDMHYGDGTDDIISNLKLDFINHYTAGKYYDNPSQASDFLSRIPDIVSSMQDCDIILYQAGADPHIDDPYGGWLTDEQLALRDRLVFQTCRDLKIPVAWNLAGGYQFPLRKILDIHDNTMRECWGIYGAGNNGNDPAGKVT